MTPILPTLTIDRPLPWIHFRLRVDGWHPLVAMRQPGRDTPWEELGELGIHQVLRLSQESPEYDPNPLRMLDSVALEDQYEEEKPSDAASEEIQVIEAVGRLREGLREAGTAIHCVGGRGRTGTVIGGFLHTIGLPHGLILKLLDEAYRDAGRPGWPESPWQGDVIGRIHA